MWIITHDLKYNVTISGVLVFDNSQQELSTEQYTKLLASNFYLTLVARGLIHESSVQPEPEINTAIRYLDGETTLNGIPINNEIVTSITVAEALARGGGVADYTLLLNKPSINGVTLIGDKTSEDLHIDPSEPDTIPDADINILFGGN